MAIIVYDITRAVSFDTLQVRGSLLRLRVSRYASGHVRARAVQVWVKELNQYVDNIVIALVGNKSDLEPQRVRVPACA